MAERLVLASASPRRRELLAALAVPFTAVEADIDEVAAAAGCAAPEEAVVAVALAKARALGPSDATVLAADTTVICDGQVLGKPVNRADAERMLRLQSGRSVDVITGVVLVGQQRHETGVVRSTVHLRSISTAEQRDYVASGAGDDKAGAMDVEGAAAPFVERVDGSRTNVQGLPLALVRRWLRDWPRGQETG